jgi:hypothetical protein
MRCPSAIWPLTCIATISHEKAGEIDRLKISRASVQVPGRGAIVIFVGCEVIFEHHASVLEPEAVNGPLKLECTVAQSSRNHGVGPSRVTVETRYTKFDDSMHTLQLTVSLLCPISKYPPGHSVCHFVVAVSPSVIWLAMHHCTVSVLQGQSKLPSQYWFVFLFNSHNECR